MTASQEAKMQVCSSTGDYEISLHNDERERIRTLAVERNEQIYTLMARYEQTNVSNPARIVTLTVETADTKGHCNLLRMHGTIIG